MEKVTTKTSLIIFTSFLILSQKNVIFAMARVKLKQITLKFHRPSVANFSIYTYNSGNELRVLETYERRQTYHDAFRMKLTH